MKVHPKWPTAALGVLALGVSLNGRAARAQTVSLDEGVFRLVASGQEVGTETFSIRQNGTGESAIVIAQGRIVLDTAGAQEVNASLELRGSAMRPSAYQVAVQGAHPERIAGRLVGGRFSARIISPSGEMMREYLASQGAVLVDDGLAHQYYFLAQRAGSGPVRVPVLVPRENRQVVATVTPAGAEPLQLGGTTVQARRLDIALTGMPARSVWVDGQGRVLKLEVPSLHFSAVRTAVPH